MKTFNPTLGIALLIVSVALSACGGMSTVAQTLIPATYYYCSSTNSCASTRVPLAKQVMNPVAAFSTNNNGTVIRLPALSAGGQASVAGELVFGVGTQQNNALPANPTILAVDGNGFFTTQYQGRAILIGIGDGARPCPCHTTRHAGPHRAVQEVEVMRVEGNRERQSIRP
jgi:hypothetical protein